MRHAHASPHSGITRHHIRKWTAQQLQATGVPRRLARAASWHPNSPLGKQGDALAVLLITKSPKAEQPVAD